MTLHYKNPAINGLGKQLQITVCINKSQISSEGEI